jgi:hypothetical protein
MNYLLIGQRVEEAEGFAEFVKKPKATWFCEVAEA